MFPRPHTTTDLYGVNYSMNSSGYSDVGVTGGSTHRKLVMQTRGRFSWVRDVKEKNAFSVSVKQKSGIQVGWLGSQDEKTLKGLQGKEGEIGGNL